MIDRLPILPSHPPISNDRCWAFSWHPTPVRILLVQWRPQAMMKRRRGMWWKNHGGGVPYSWSEFISKFSFTNFTFSFSSEYSMKLKLCHKILIATHLGKMCKIIPRKKEKSREAKKSSIVSFVRLQSTCPSVGSLPNEPSHCNGAQTHGGN